MKATVIATLVALAASFIVSDAFAQASDPDVALQREAPFDHWCVAPLCTGQPGQRPPIVKLPAVITPSSSQGLVEQQLKRSLSDSLEDAAKLTLGPTYNEAIADLAAAIAATATGDAERLQRVRGLGAAVLRAALVYYLDSLVPTDPACVAPRRYDAIYEGLAVSVSLAPLEFPRRRGLIAQSCAATAKATARAVDSAVLAAVTPDYAKTAVTTIAQQVEDAKQKCASLPGAVDDTLARVRAADESFRAGSLVGLARALRTLRAAPVDLSSAGPDPTPAEKACTAALDVLRAADPAPLEALANAGLADVPIVSLAASFAVPSPGVSFAFVTRIAHGTTTTADWTTLVEALANQAGLPASTPVMKDAVDTLAQAVVVRETGPTIDPNIILAYLETKYDVGKDGKPSVRSLLGLKPTPWVFELNGGLPNVDFSQQKVVADATLGYATPKVGVVGRGYVDNYDINDSQVHNDYLHAGGSLEAWWLSGGYDSPVRVEVRLSGGFDYYDTTTYPLHDALSNFYDFDSRVGRGTLFVGVRYGQPLSRVSLQLLLGGGAQYEDPDTTTYTGGNNFLLQSDTNFSAQASGRFKMRVRVVPQIVGIRVKMDTLYFNLTREQLSAAITPAGNITTSSIVEVEQQFELHGRVFLDADIAELAGFVPALFGGFDYLGISGSSTTQSTFIPLLGVGIVRQTW